MRSKESGFSPTPKFMMAQRVRDRAILPHLLGVCRCCLECSYFLSSAILCRGEARGL